MPCVVGCADCAISVREQIDGLSGADVHRTKCIYGADVHRMKCISGADVHRIKMRNWRVCAPILDLVSPRWDPHVAPPKGARNDKNYNRVRGRYAERDKTQ